MKGPGRYANCRTSNVLGVRPNIFSQAKHGERRPLNPARLKHTRIHASYLTVHTSCRSLHWFVLSSKQAFCSTSKCSGAGGRAVFESRCDPIGIALYYCCFQPGFFCVACNEQQWAEEPGVFASLHGVLETISLDFYLLTVVEGRTLLLKSLGRVLQQGEKLAATLYFPVSSLCTPSPT